MTAEEEAQLKQYLQNINPEDRNSPYAPENVEPPEYGPITFWDKRELIVSNKDVRPDGLAMPAAKTITLAYALTIEDAVVFVDPNTDLDERLIAGMFLIPTPAKFGKPFLKHADDVGGAANAGRKGKIDGNSLKSKSKDNARKNLDDVPKTKEIEVNFNRNVKHDSEEFVRQLKDQEKGMNELTIDEYFKNRERYIAEGRAIEGNAAQKIARQEAYKDKVAELRKQGLSRADATKKASEWLDTKAALHNPDQIAGGKADIIGGMGDKRVNSSIGSQWKYRIDVVDEQIKEIAKDMPPEKLKNTYLNVKLTQ